MLVEKNLTTLEVKDKIWKDIDLLHELSEDVGILYACQTLGKVQVDSCVGNISRVRDMLRREISEILLSEDNDRYTNCLDREMEDNPK